MQAFCGFKLQNKCVEITFILLFARILPDFIGDTDPNLKAYLSIHKERNFAKPLYSLYQWAYYLHNRNVFENDKLLKTKKSYL
jgi:hypothetical protein